MHAEVGISQDEGVKINSKPKALECDQSIAFSVHKKAKQGAQNVVITLDFQGECHSKKQGLTVKLPVKIIVD